VHGTITRCSAASATGRGRDRSRGSRLRKLAIWPDFDRLADLPHSPVGTIIEVMGDFCGGRDNPPPPPLSRPKLPRRFSERLPVVRFSGRKDQKCCGSERRLPLCLRNGPHREIFWPGARA